MHFPALLAIAIGFVAGLRSMVAPAAVAYAKGSVFLAAVFGLAAIGEVIGDKLPRAPSRLIPPALAIRCISGGVCAYFLAGGAASAPLGAIGAVLGSFAGAAYRKAFPQIIAAIIEDVIAVTLAALLVLSR
jgi:uncharacterized membrane protein